MAIIIGYITAAVLCIVLDAPLISNSNRAGMFHRLLQWMVLDLNSAQVSLRSLSSQLFFYSLQKTQLFPFFLDRKMVMKDSISFTDGQGGSLGLLVVIVPSSLRPIRRFCYGNFYIIQCAASFHPNYANLDFTPSMLSFIVFFVTICYHTIYSSPWIFSPLALYGLDLLMRMSRHRIKDAVLVPIGNQMTLVSR